MTTNTATHTDVLTARAALSTIIEPGDGVAGSLIDTLGPVALFEAMTGNGLRSTLQNAGVSAHQLDESIARWTSRISSTTIAENLAAVHREGVTLVDPDTVPALADLGAHRPIALYVRGDSALLNSARSVTVVGARASTGYGEHVTTEIVSGLASHGITVTSGAAYVH